MRRIPVYVVAAGAERVGPPPMPLPRGRAPGNLLVELVGTRHAVARTPGTDAEPRVLCGADLSNWPLFPHLEFAPGHPASCQHCAQLALGATAECDAHRPEVLRGSPGPAIPQP